LALNFSPGVSITATGDDQGQRYRTPEVMRENGSHIFIVGRGIYNSDDPVSSVKEYQQRCYANIIDNMFK
jgi:uridine monophosphate synthetase